MFFVSALVLGGIGAFFPYISFADNSRCWKVVHLLENVFICIVRNQPKWWNDNDDDDDDD